jgi:hypothetical protein
MKSKAEKKININNEEIKRIENRIIPIDAELTIFAAELVRQRATPSGTIGRTGRINAEFKKERDKNAIKLPLETEKTRLETEVTNLGADILTIEGEITTLEAEIATINRTNEILKAEAKLRGASAEEILKIEQSSASLRIKARQRYNKEVSNADRAAADENLKEIKKEEQAIKLSEIEQQIARKEAKKVANENSKKDAKQLAEEQKRLLDEEKERRIAKDERESAAQKIQIDAFRSTLDKRNQDLLAAEDEFENKKGELIKANDLDFTKVEEEFRLKKLEINKTYNKLEEDEENKINEKKKSVL